MTSKIITFFVNTCVFAILTKLVYMKEQFLYKFFPKCESIVDASIFEKHIFQSAGGGFFSKIGVSANDFNADESKNFCEQLPILKKLSPDVQPDLKNVVFVCGQHLLKNIPPMLNQYQKWGAEKIFVVGKSYSNNEQAIKDLKSSGICVQPTSKQMSLGGFSTAYNTDINNMWRSCLKHIVKVKNPKRKIIVLDDGGGVLGNIPQEIKEMSIPLVGIEQTSSGMPTTEVLPYPIIGVANAAIKSWFEPTWVAEQSLNEIEKHLVDVGKKYNISTSKESVIGIIGVGNIGLAMLQKCIKRGYTNFIINDVDAEKVKQATLLSKQHNVKIQTVKKIWQVIYGADIICGGTGTNILSNNIEMLQVIRLLKIICSLSSKDTEWKEFLEYIQKQNRSHSFDPLQDIYCKNGFDAPAIILRGGTPVGFNNAPECIPTPQISLIRALKVQAVKQALEFLNADQMPEPGNYMVDPQLQFEALEAWHDLYHDDLYKSVLASVCHNKTDKNSIINAIKEHSGGILLSDNNALDKTIKMKL